MASSMLAAYSSGETARVLVSIATSTSARPLGSRNSTTLLPTKDDGRSALVQDVGAAIENRPCGSFQVTRLPGAAAPGALAPTVAARATGTVGTTIVGRGCGVPAAELEAS